MTDFLPPGNTPAWADSDPSNQIAQIWQGDMWPELWPKLVLTYANTAARDADLAGLGPSDVAYAFLADSRTLWRWTGSAWGLAAPWTQIGTQAPLNAVAAGASVDVTIVFPLAFTSSAYKPDVEVSFQSNRLDWGVVSRSTTQMVIRFDNYTASSSAAAGTLYWSATLAP